jgi:excisionase family DNA binding protein
MSNSVDLSNVKFPEQMDLRTAALYLGVSEMRIRTLAHQGGLKGVKDDGGKWLFSKVTLDGYKATPHVRKSGGGRVSAAGKAWVIHVKPADHEKVVAALKSMSITLEPRYDYAGQKEYRLKRAADLKAKGAPATTKASAPAASAKK